MLISLFSRLLLVALVLGGCDALIGEKEKPEPEDPMIEARRHVEKFVAEAAARGLDARPAVDALTINFRDQLIFDGAEFCGYVPLGEDDRYGSELLLSRRPECWDDVSTEGREALLFHELGHAVLDRWHREDRLPNGSSASLMVAKGYQRLYTGNAKNRRGYYVDELFNEETPPPDWAGSNVR